MRIHISISEEMVKRIDEYARMMGVPRATFCTMLIGQGVMNYDKAYSIAESTLKDVADKMADEEIKVGE